MGRAVREGAGSAKTAEDKGVRAELTCRKGWSRSESRRNGQGMTGEGWGLGMTVEGRGQR